MRRIAHAREIGLDVVVTDHHQPRETLPEAVAVVDPHRPDCPSPFKGLAGVGVAFKLVCALDGDDGSELIEQYGDLTALGTVGDVMPLTHDQPHLCPARAGPAGRQHPPGDPGADPRRRARRPGPYRHQCGLRSGAPASMPPGGWAMSYDALELLLTESEDHRRREGGDPLRL